MAVGADLGARSKHCPDATDDINIRHGIEAQRERRKAAGEFRLVALRERDRIKKHAYVVPIILCPSLEKSLEL